MSTYLVRKLFSSLILLVALAALTFFTLRLIPGGPFDDERALPPEVQANVLAHYQLDQPLPAQFARWLGDVARGDLHESYQYIGRPVREIIIEAFGFSCILGSLSLVFATLLGLCLGALAAWRSGTIWDRLISGGAIASVSLPNYLVAALLVLLFSLKLGWLPPALWDGPASLVLPVLAMALRPLALILRLVRATLRDVLGEDYIRTARAKGVSERTILFKHALRNSLVPLLSLTGPLVANAITGSFVIETVFQLPGMGRYFVTAILNRDYPLVMGTTLVYGALLIAADLVSDWGLALADPRIQHGRLETA